MSAHPLAGKPAPKDLLIDVNKFEEAFYASKPDPADVNQLVSFGDIGGRLFTVDLALESALSRVVIEQICEIVRRNEIIYRSDLIALLEESLLNHRTKEEPPDASEAIDADCSHLNVVVGVCGWGT